MSPITRLRVSPVFNKGCEAILFHTADTLETDNNMKNSLCKLQGTTVSPCDGIKVATDENTHLHVNIPKIMVPGLVVKFYNVLFLIKVVYKQLK